MKGFNFSEVSYSKIINNALNSSVGSYWNKEHEHEHDHEHEHASRFLDGVFLFIAIISIICNAFVVILFANNKKWLEKSYGRLVLSLATVDLLSAIFLFATPLAVHHQFKMIQPRNAIKRILYCNLLWSHYILFSFGITSIYTCLVLTIERWIAVSRPLYARKYKSTRWHKIMWLALPWIVGFSLEANIVNEIQIKHYDDGYFSCQWRTQKGGTISAVLATISFLGGMIAPLFIISVMYVHILITLRRKKTINREVYLILKFKC